MANSTSSTASNSSSGRLCSASNSISVICQEVFDENCQPSAEEIKEYAHLLSIDAVKEAHLLYLAREGLMQALPADWKICYSEEKCGHYYYNTKTKQSQWDHPLDAVYRELVQQARQRHVTPLVDNSDDASQMDSGIRSLQCNDDCDTTNTVTNNTANEVSSPLSNATQAVIISGAAAPSLNRPMSVFPLSNPNSGANSTSNSTSGFSGGVSRFLESRSKNFVGMNFQQVKNTRFEVAKTNLQHGISMRFPSAATGGIGNVDENVDGEKKGYSLSGTGALFLKSRRQIESGLQQATTMLVSNSHPAVGGILVEGMAGTPPGVKGILRDSSLTDMRRRTDKEDYDKEEDKKSVRFNLEELKMRNSPEEDASSSRRLTQSPEVSINSDDDAEDDDPWDDDDDQPAVVVEGCQRGLNPFLMNGERHMREIKVISVPKAQTIQMLKTQSFSMDIPDRNPAKLIELARSQSVEVGAAAAEIPVVSAVSYLDKLKDSTVATVKPLYDDTDSESKGSSVRSFIINKSEQDSLGTAVGTNPFDLDELGRKHSRDVEQLEMKLQTNAASSLGAEKADLCTLEVASKLMGSLKKDFDKPHEVIKQERNSEKTYIQISERQLILKEERERLEEQLQQEIDSIKREHEQKMKSIRHEYELTLTSHQHQLEESLDGQVEEYRAHCAVELDMKRKIVVDEHKAQMGTLQNNHAEILQDLNRDLKSEIEIVKKEHALQLTELRDKMAHEMELERQRIRDGGEDRLYEKVRCEKRLLEDKYRCLKEKYVRLKTDVKLSLERRNRRREAQALQQQSLQTTGSETERSISNKPSIGNSENRSLSISTSCQEHGGGTSTVSLGGGGPLFPSGVVGSGKQLKPPIPPKTHLKAASANDQGRRECSTERSIDGAQHSLGQCGGSGGVGTRKPGIVSKYMKHLQVQDDNSTSITQSETTISNNYCKGHYLPAAANCVAVLSDNGNSDSEAYNCNNQENNNNAALGNAQRKKVFSRLKSASTSRLNSDNYKCDRPCTPVENLRHQLQKLEDLEDQFPDNTLDTTYHLRYPFSDISNEHAGASSELEFFKHRIHLERDSVRRAKESLRSQRTNFRSRQREIKLRHKASVTRHTLDQLIKEEKELTEMEVNLHRTRALLGEKVIRLRHLEQSLLRIYEKEKPSLDLLAVEQRDDATLSDLSSHSSSGFSSTDFASGAADTQNVNKRKDAYHQESSECIQNLEILNAEIRDILEILGKSQQSPQQQHNVPLMSPPELNWPHMLGSSVASSATISSAHHNLHAGPSLLHHTPQSIPTLADRLETYRQLATGRMQSSMGGAMLAANTIVSQSPRALNYTTSLVERTRDLRNWLRQAKNEHEILTVMAATASAAHHGHNMKGLGGNADAAVGSAAAGVGSSTAALTNI